MNTEPFPLDAYLARIGLTQPPTRDLAGLSQLMRAQLFSVPFENLDVQAGREISLAPGDVIDKIIRRRRGGYCYEVNSLFAMALHALGFEYRILGARPMFYPSRRPKTHMVLAVQLGDTAYLCDTGFGSYGLRAPLAIAASDEGVVQDFDRFRLQPINSRELALQTWVEGAWANQFSFDDYAMELLDFWPANYFNSHSPEAIFVQKILILQHRPDARTLLVGDQYKKITAEGVQVQTWSAQDLSVRIQQEFALPYPLPAL